MEDYDRLRVIARVCLTDNKTWDGAKDAFFKAVRGDAGLLWVLFAGQRLHVVQALLTEVSAAMRVPAGAAPKVAPDSKAVIKDDTAYRNAALASRSNMAKKSLLDTFRVGGRAIGDVTPEVARKWAAAKRVDAAFVDALTANLPPTEPIRKHRSADDTQKIFDEVVSAAKVE